MRSSIPPGSTRAPALLLAGLFAASPSGALVIDSDTPTTEEAPKQGFGWDHVGRLGKVSAVYLGSGWVITARHAGRGPVDLAGVVHTLVGKRVVLEAPGRRDKKSDLALFRVEPIPELPPLEIANSPPARGTRTLLVGFGWGRGEAVGQAGFRWGAPQKKRWGTNRVSRGGLDIPGPNQALTRCFRTDFSRAGTRHEAQAANGDSGGAVFTRAEGGWQLAGIMVAVSTDPGQEPKTAFFGNVTNIADLSAYAVQIRHWLGRTKTH